MTTRAAAYVSDIILGQTGEIITRAWQRQQIENHAREQGIEIVAWFEDDMYNEQVASRPGVKAMLTSDTSYDLVLVERVWSLSRNMQRLEPVFSEMAKRGVRLESATTMWDCTSQMCRRHFHEAKAAFQPRPVVAREADRARVKVRKPARLNFVVLKKVT